MKVVCIGVGQCGGNIADEFYDINNYAKSIFGRRMEILLDAFAINTDETDLESIRHIPKDKQHRIVIGSSRTFGHGVGKINAEGARIMRDSHRTVSDTVLNSRRFHECDAVVVVAGGAGGTGSGGIGWLVKGLKERIEKPVYGIVVLPFAYEEKGETSYAVINTATCIKTLGQHADAVFLLDNERFGRADIRLASNFSEINWRIARSFFDLFCAGEERTQKYIGSKVIDAGDIMQTVEGISTVGRGEVKLPTFYRWKKNNFREAMNGNVGTAGALTQAINNMGIKASIGDAMKILALVTAPKDAITIGVMEEIADVLQERAPKAVVRLGDYPRTGSEISVTLVVSKLTSVRRMESVFLHAEQLLNQKDDIERQARERILAMHHTSDNIPSLT